MASRRRRWLAALLLLLPIFLFRASLLQWYGNLLVDSAPPVKADAILVLAGDFGGDRIRHAATLVRQGYAPYALVSGPMPIYGVNEADLAIAMARREGFIDERLEPVYLKASSTLEESRKFAPELQRRGIHSILVVTSDYHTARAGRLFRRVLGGRTQVRMVATPDVHFPRASWWREREGLKTVFYESLKTISSAVEQ